MSNLKNYAISELSRIGMSESDEGMNGQMAKHIIKMVELFSEEGHSGFSASYAVNILDKLLRFRPLSPLTGSDDEWMEVGEGLYQNKRCSTVFKKDGTAYDIDGKVFVESDGQSYTSSNSKVDVSFPYTPKTEYVYV